MAEAEERPRSLLDRVKDRAVVQWTLAYLAAAWAVVEIVDFASTQFYWSSMIPRGAAILAVAGLFFTIVLAWYHGEKGQQRVSGSELLMLAALFVAAGLALSVLGPGAPPTEFPRSTATPAGDDLPRVAVLPCTNQSPDPADPYRAAGLHDEILLKLQKIGALESIGRTSVRRYADAAVFTPEIVAELDVDLASSTRTCSSPYRPGVGRVCT